MAEIDKDDSELNDLLDDALEDFKKCDESKTTCLSGQKCASVQANDAFPDSLLFYPQNTS